MQAIEAILLEPVGCLAEFPPAPFDEIARRFFNWTGEPSQSGSRAYWNVLNLMEAGVPAGPEEFEVEAVAGATIYEDVVPVLAELKAMGVRLFIASSLSRTAVAKFVERYSLGGFFAGVSTRTDAGGIQSVPLLAVPIAPEKAVFLTDTAEGIKAARGAGVHPVLMMNDPDEARRLATLNPAGGVVSFHEIPDFLRLIFAQNCARNIHGTQRPGVS